MRRQFHKGKHLDKVLVLLQMPRPAFDARLCDLLVDMKILNVEVRDPAFQGVYFTRRRRNSMVSPRPSTRVERCPAVARQRCHGGCERSDSRLSSVRETSESPLVENHDRKPRTKDHGKTGLAAPPDRARSSKDSGALVQPLCGSR